jgi:hypothetical protein
MGRKYLVNTVFHGANMILFSPRTTDWNALKMIVNSEHRSILTALLGCRASIEGFTFMVPAR